MGMIRSGDYIYIAYDRQDGLPIAVADTVKELADILGINSRTVSRGLAKGSRLYGRVKNDEQQTEG